MSDNNSLIFTIKNKGPIELIDLSNSFLSLGNQYQRFLEKGENPYGQELKLFVKEVKPGSIIAELFTQPSLAVGALAFAENYITIINFLKYLKESYDYFSGIKKEKDYTYQKNDLKDLSSIVEPVAKDNGSQMIFQNCENIYFGIDFTNANVIQNKIRNEMEKIPRSVSLTNVPFKLYQSRIPKDLTTGYKSIIETVSDKPITTSFETELIRDKIVDTLENPFHRSFIVNANVTFEENIPVRYHITYINED